MTSQRGRGRAGRGRKPPEAMEDRQPNALGRRGKRGSGANSEKGSPKPYGAVPPPSFYFEGAGASNGGATQKVTPLAPSTPVPECPDGPTEVSKRKKERHRTKTKTKPAVSVQRVDSPIDGDMVTQVSAQQGQSSNEGERGRASKTRQEQNRKGKRRGRRFDDYLEDGALRKGLDDGTIFKGVVRVNAHNSRESYATLDGVSVDILFKGKFQNRSVEGDVVAFSVLPPSRWDLKLPSRASLNSDTEGTPSSKVRDGDQEDDVEETFEVESEVLRRMTDLQIDNGSGPSAESDMKMTVSAIERHLHATRRRPMGDVVAIIEPSPRRRRVLGSLHSQPQQSRDPNKAQTDDNVLPPHLVQLTPLDMKMPKCLVRRSSLPREAAEALRKAEVQPPCDEIGADSEVRSPESPDRVLDSESIQRQKSLESFRSKKGGGGCLIVQAEILDWAADARMPLASVVETVGRAGDIHIESDAILQDCRVDSSAFSPEVEACLPSTPWYVSQEDIAERRDFRHERIFSIDPPTARDLDDALSVSALEDGHYRVGVHIADVSHFVPVDSALDAEAASRATSVYLVQQVIPMLPRLLCEQLCSLNPGVDRLAMSVEWTLDGEGRVVGSPWLGRSVIRSCCKLSYGLAQQLADGTPEEDMRDELPDLYGEHQWEDVRQDIKNLNMLAKAMRKRRFARGALRLDKTKMLFERDECGYPVRAFPYESQDTNKLVEEFMLLANASVARVISTAFPDLAILRRHQPPKQNKLDEFIDWMAKLGFFIDATSSGALHNSLTRLADSVAHPDDVPALVNMCTKPMQLAQYFCTGETLDGVLPEDDGKDNDGNMLQLSMDDIRIDTWRHYALAMSHYTHFTSPIRRYPDILVHRLLAAALTVWDGKPFDESFDQDKISIDPPIPNKPIPTLDPQRQDIVDKYLGAGTTPQRLKGQAMHCNGKKEGAKNAQERSDKLFLCILLRDHPRPCEAIILGLGSKFLTVFVSSFGLECRIYMEDEPGMVSRYDEGDGRVHLALEYGVVKDETEAGLREGGIEPLAMPAELQMLQHVPIILSARFQRPCPPEVKARLYLR